LKELPTEISKLKSLTKLELTNNKFDSNLAAIISKNDVQETLAYLQRLIKVQEPTTSQIVLPSKSARPAPTQENSIAVKVNSSIMFDFYHKENIQLRQELARVKTGLEQQEHILKQCLEEIESQNTRITIHEREKELLLKEKDEIEMHTLCTICCDRFRDTIFLPCKHLLICHYCSQKQQEENFESNKCFLCRTFILQRIKIFMS
jgi:hypothetical protein